MPSRTQGKNTRGSAARIVLIAAGSLVLLAGLVLTLAPLFIPWDKVKAQAETKLSAVLHHPVTIGSVGFNFWRGITVRGIRIGNAAGFSSEPLLSAETALVQYRLWPLLLGRVLVKAVILEKPAILVERAASGAFNFSDMLTARAADPAAPAQAAPSAAEKRSLPKIPLDLLVARFALTEGRFAFHDLKTQQTYALDGVNFSVTNLTLAGLTPVHVDLAFMVQALDLKLPVSVKADWRIAYAQERLTIDSLEASVLGIALQARGAVETFASTPAADLSGAIQIDSARLQSGLAPLLQARGLDLKLGGAGRVQFTVKGPVTDLAQLTADVSNDLDLRVGTLGLDLPVQWKGTLGVSGGAAKAEQLLSVPGLRIEAAVKLDDLAAVRTLDARVTGRLDLSEAAAKLVPPGQAAALAGLKTQGVVQVEAAGQGPLSKPESMSLTGRVQARAVGVELNGKSVLAKTQALLTVSPDRVSLSETKGELAGQTFSAAFTAKGFDLRRPETLKPEALKTQLDWSVRSALLDVDALLALVPVKPASAGSTPVATASMNAPGPASKAETTKPRGALPAGLVMNGRADLGGLKFGQVKLGQMGFQMNAKQGILTESGTIQGYRGTVTEKLKLDLSRPTPAYQVDAAVKSVDVEPLLNDIVETFVAAKLKKPELVAELKDKFTGRLSGQIQVKGSGTQDVKAGLTGQGNFTLADGRMRKMAFQDKLAALFGSEKFAQDIPFDRVVTEFTMAEEMVNVSRFVAESGPNGEGGDIRIQAEGRLTFAADFKDFRLRPALSPRSASTLSDQFRQYSEVLKDELGWVHIPVVMNGPVKKPDVQPDWDWIKKQAGEYAQRKLKSAASEAGKKIQNFIEQQKGKPAGQLGQDLGEQLNKAKEGLGDLKNFFK